MNHHTRFRSIGKLLAVFLPLLLVAAACGDDDTSSDDTSPATSDNASPTTAGEQAADGPSGTAEVSYSVANFTMDPHLSTTAANDIHMFLVYDRLIFFNADAELEPMLASGWEFSDDGRTLTMQLRDDVVFSDGARFDADTVVANLDRAMTIEGGTQANLLAGIAEVVAVDPTTVEFRLTDAYQADLPATLATSAGIMVSPEALDNTDLATAPVGSGPYVVDEYIQDDRVIFEPNTNYWGSDSGTPKLERLEILGIRENDARYNALQSGEIDAALAKVDQAAATERLVSSGDFVLYEGDPSLSQLTMFLNSERSEFADQRVRQAITHAIDREAISEALTGGAAPPAGQIFPEGYWAAAPDVDADYLGYDIDQAKALLSEAGLSDGFAFTLVVQQGLQPQNDMAAIIQAQLAEIGVDVNVEAREGQVALTDFTSGNADALMAQIEGRNDPNQIVELNVLDRFNPGGASQEIIDLATEANSSHLSQEERAPLYQELSKLVADEAYMVNIAQQVTGILAVPELTGLDRLPWANVGTRWELRFIGREG